jgi:hypothetical protein
MSVAIKQLYIIILLTVSSNLKWNDHIYQTIVKARKRLYFLTQLKRANVGIDELVRFYSTCIRPILKYACPVFHNSLFIITYLMI